MRLMQTAAARRLAEPPHCDRLNMWLIFSTPEPSWVGYGKVARSDPSRGDAPCSLDVMACCQSRLHPTQAQNLSLSLKSSGPARRLRSPSLCQAGTSPSLSWCSGKTVSLLCHDFIISVTFSWCSAFRTCTALTATSLWKSMHQSIAFLCLITHSRK